MPAWLIPAISAALSGGMALKQIFSDPVSGRMESWLDYLENRAKHGISGAERADIETIYGSQVMRGASAAQSKLAAAGASRGVSSSSAMDMGIASIWGEAAGVVPAIQAKADLAARSGAQQSYDSLLGYTDQLRATSKGAGYSALGGAIGEGFGMLQDAFYPEAGMEDLLKMIFGERLLPDLDKPSTAVGTVWGD